MRVGHAQDATLASGVTAVIFDAPAVASIAIHGGAPGVRGRGLLEPEMSVERIDALTLSGGSVFGLDAAGGVLRPCAARFVHVLRSVPAINERVNHVASDVAGPTITRIVMPSNPSDPSQLGSREPNSKGMCSGPGTSSPSMRSTETALLMPNSAIFQFTAAA